MRRTTLRFTLLCGGIAAFFRPMGASADEPASRVSPLETSTVEVIGETPLPGLGVPRNDVPANVQAIGGEEIRQRQIRDLPELFDEALPSVNVNTITGNPFQADVNYRGFTASPLLGTAQGLSV
ncbi:MAG TPA: Plug domain-containing protein, partial [Rhodocyclaceae bacterium]|nr:Plug domain-containing protein [Rhodocyclaceae bacterium]